MRAWAWEASTEAWGSRTGPSRPATPPTARAPSCRGRGLELFHLSHAFTARQAGGERRSRREVAGGRVRGGVRALVTVAVLLRGVGGPGGSSFGPRILVFMLGYRLTADDEGERGSSGGAPGDVRLPLDQHARLILTEPLLELALEHGLPGNAARRTLRASRAPTNPKNRRVSCRDREKMRESPRTDSRSQQRRRVAGCARSVCTTRDKERGGKRPRRRARRAWQRAGSNAAPFGDRADNSISRATFHRQRHASHAWS